MPVFGTCEKQYFAGFGLIDMCPVLHFVAYKYAAMNLKKPANWSWDNFFFSTIWFVFAPIAQEPVFSPNENTGSLTVWNGFAYGEQMMRAADRKKWRKSPKGFFGKFPCREQRFRQGKEAFRQCPGRSWHRQPSGSRQCWRRQRSCPPCRIPWPRCPGCGKCSP